MSERKRLPLFESKSFLGCSEPELLRWTQAGLIRAVPEEEVGATEFRGEIRKPLFWYEADLKAAAPQVLTWRKADQDRIKVVYKRRRSFSAPA
jgi:hypothetical protein